MKDIFNTIGDLLARHRTIILFLISGGSAAMFQLVLYVVLTRVFHVQYLIASSVSFVAAVVVSFLLQKFVAFQNTDTQAIPKQFVWFGILAFCNLHANAFLMVFFVEYLHVYDVLAQICNMGIIAVWSFFAYRHFIFR